MDTSTVRRRGSAMTIIVLIVVIVIIAFAVVKTSKNKSTTGAAGKTTIAAADLLTYDGTTQGFGFSYPKTWKVDKVSDTTVSVADPSLPQGNAITSIADVNGMMIQSLPYATGSTDSHAVQVEALVAQMAASGTKAAITVGAMTGSSVGIAATANTELSTYNVILAGTKNMYMLQFFGRSGLDKLTAGESTLLNSFVEK